MTTIKTAKNISVPAINEASFRAKYALKRRVGKTAAKRAGMSGPAYRKKTFGNESAAKVLSKGAK